MIKFGDYVRIKYGFYSGCTGTVINKNSPNGQIQYAIEGYKDIKSNGIMLFTAYEKESNLIKES